MTKYLLTIIAILSFIPSFSQNWQDLGNGLNFVPRDLYTDTAANRLYAIGIFTYADDTVPVNNIAFWDGLKWNDLDSGNTSCPPNCNPITGVTSFQGGVYVSGQFTSFHNVPNTKFMARFNGTNWESIGNTNGMLSFHNYNNQLLATGYFDTIGGVYAKNFALYDGVNWLPFDTSTFLGSSDFVDCIAEYSGELYVGGNFDQPNGIEEIAKWDGSQWVNVGGGILGNSWVEKMLVYKNELYVAGNFSKANGNAGNGIMKWDGTNWSDLNYGLTFDIGAQIKDMVIYNGDLIIVGFPTTADGIPVQNIVKWDGTKWCNFRNNFNGTAENVEVYNNELIVGCRDTMDNDPVKWIAKWIGGNQADTCGIVGIYDNNKENKFNIFPNPNNGIFTIETNTFENTSVSIFNITGQIIFKGKLSQAFTSINLSEYSKGIYFVKIKTSTETFTEKLVVN